MKNVSVVILRGLPGAGKSTYAESLDDAFVVSADKYPGLYNGTKIDFTKLSEAHLWCFRKYCIALEMSVNWRGKVWTSAPPAKIVVDNTNIKIAELAPYWMMARRHEIPVEIVSIAPRLCAEDLASRTLHGVPATSIARMAESFEDLPSYMGREIFVR